MKARKTLWRVGMMGAGKSAVGPALAARMGVPFVDTDSDVVARSGRSICEIFANQGEASFRALERESSLALAGQAVAATIAWELSSCPDALSSEVSP